MIFGGISYSREDHFDLYEPSVSLPSILCLLCLRYFPDGKSSFIHLIIMRESSGNFNRTHKLRNTWKKSLIG